MRRTILYAALAGLACAIQGCRAAPATTLSLDDAEKLLVPLERPIGSQKVFHLGHSLVGRDMPTMLTQLAGTGHVSHFQIGWGTSLKNHWDDQVNGLAEENNHASARRAYPAIDEGTYDAVVFTEMVEIRDAIRYHDSADYLQRWAGRAHAANPQARLYFYESWPQINDKEGWLQRVEKDLTRHWENEILLPAIQASGQPIYLVPGGQALAAVVKTVIALGDVDGVSRVEDFFALAADGSQDMIHLNDLGNYVIAVAHYAVLYHANPAGLPRALLRADGAPAEPPGPALAELIQTSVWETVLAHSKTGIHRQV